MALTGIFIMLLTNNLKQLQIGSCVFCAPLDRHIGQHIDRHAIDIGQHIDRFSTDMSLEISIDTKADIQIEICRSTYRLIYQPRYRPSNGRHID